MAPASPSRCVASLPASGPRRIDQEHRLVYAVEEKRIYFLAARHHY